MTENDELAKTYTYDAFNRLSTYTADGVTASYTYDGDNLRQSKTVNGSTVNHLLDGANVVADIYPDSTNIYVYGNGVELFKTGGQTSRYTKSYRGDVTAVTTGDTKTEYFYDAFGNKQTDTDTSTNPFEYCGEYFDDETGLIYLRNRYYDPTIGRFITEDPIRDGENWYVYAGNNPVNFVDFSGLYTLEIDEYGNAIVTIENGDTLSDIAKSQVNDASAWKKIDYKGDVNNLKVGEKININGIYNKYYPRPIEKEKFYKVAVGDTYIKVALQDNIIRTSLIDGYAKKLIKNSPNNAIAIALHEKEFYKNVFGESIEISDMSLAVEILGHAYPDALARKFNVKFVSRRTEIIDSGTKSVDRNRGVWDKLSLNLSFQEYVNIFSK